MITSSLLLPKQLHRRIRAPPQMRSALVCAPNAADANNLLRVRLCCVVLAQADALRELFVTRRYHS